MILSIDLGTSLTKVGLWSQDRLVALGRSRLETIHGADGQAEQDASRWWASVQEATRQAFSVLSTDGGGTEVEAIGFSTARQTFVPVDRHCRPLGNALLWNDRRAAAEAAILIEALGGQAALRQRTGIYYDAGSVAAKMAWLACNDPARLKSASWLVGPRDLVAFELTGEVVSDVTVASASGLYDSTGVPLADVLQAAMSMDGGPASGLASPRRDPAALLPRPVGSDCIVGWLLADAAAQLGLAAGIPVIAGAGDRQCE
ncbi:MAG TPA: FGGY family carbohydrate kinase, partial [Acidimicrobiales bacterium]|nr:FGGY family carbohydrate kinase [Acidimicrobiales bacterium]